MSTTGQHPTSVAGRALQEPGLFGHGETGHFQTTHIHAGNHPPNGNELRVVGVPLSIRLPTDLLLLASSEVRSVNLVLYLYLFKRSP